MLLVSEEHGVFQNNTSSFLLKKGSSFLGVLFLSSSFEEGFSETHEEEEEEAKEESLCFSKQLFFYTLSLIAGISSKV